MRTYRAEYRLCYAHRVWSPEYSYDEECRMIHGHTADLSLVVTYDREKTLHRTVEKTIDETFMFMNKNIFNRFLIDTADPMFYTLVSSLYESVAVEFNVDVFNTAHNFYVPIIMPESNHVIAHEVNLSPFERAKNSPIYDVLRSYFITDFCPSSDNLSKWLYEMVNSRIKMIGATLDHVEWSSVPNRKIIYSP